RYANVHIIVRPSLVQGKTAVEDIARGIADLNAYGDVDVIIVGRGGGSMEDLWPFNEEAVARAVYNSRIPVISAVGHEIDYTICDFVADVRAPTPSAAAELVVQEKTRLLTTLDIFRKRLNEAITKQLTGSRSRFSRIVGSYALRRPHLIVEQYQQRLDSLDKAIKVGMVHAVKAHQARVQQATSRIISLRGIIDQAEQKVAQADKALPMLMAHTLRTKEGLLRQISSRLYNLNPLAILSRGYSVTCVQETRQVLKDTGGLKKGDRIETKLNKGVIISQVEECRS
ncbi:MAG: exodeoxyribonuclease VII large subunit, partial [Candidatus Omnitrophica bacterium]|nr:exodeoxyribonuclease VII large subunit [Candidatus Omnitrophota bacterium]